MTKHVVLPLSVRGFLDRAKEIADVDLEDRDAIEPLTVLIDSFNTESRLHEAGTISLQNQLLRMLANRLRMLRDWTAHPEIAEQVIHRPVFVGGYLRTGSTKMARLITASDDFNALPLWKALNPASYSGVPGEDVSARIADTEVFLDDLYTGSPDAAAVHEQGVHLVEEESYFFTQHLRCTGFVSYANVPSYIEWLAKQDMSSTYEYLRDMLKYLQWQGLSDPAKRWFLKSPFHWGQEATLARVFPDASIIFTHRAPSQVIPSMCHLVAAYMRKHTDAVAIDGPAFVAGFRHALDSHFAFRAARPDFPMLDVDYRELIDDVGGIVRRVYAFLGLDLTDEAFARMKAWDAQNPIHKRGSAKYAPEHFGLTAEGIDQACGDYVDFYHSHVETAASTARGQSNG